MQQIAENIWEFSKPLQVAGLNLGARMTVVRLKSGELWVHSPVRLTQDTKAALHDLGPVAHVLCPNTMHHLFVKSYSDYYPQAQIWGVEGLKKKRPDVHFHHQFEEKPPVAWSEEIDQHLIQGVRGLNEVVFYHKKSKTLIVTDLMFNVQKMSGLWMNAAMYLNGTRGRLTPSRTFRLLIKSKKDFKSSLQVIQAWQPENLVLAHGEIILKGALEQFNQAFSAFL